MLGFTEWAHIFINPINNNGDVSITKFYSDPHLTILKSPSNLGKKPRNSVKDYIYLFTEVATDSQRQYQIIKVKFQSYELAMNYCRDYGIPGIYFGTLIVSIICFLPIMLGRDLNLSKYDDEESVPMKRNMKTTEFQFCIVTSIAASLPVLLDLIIDSFQASTRDLYESKLAVWLVLLSSIIPNIFSYWYIMPHSHYEYIPSIMAARAIAVMMSSTLVSNAYGPSVWISLVFIRIYFGSSTDVDATSSSIICQIYMLTAYSVVISALNDRVIRKKITIAQAQNEAEMKHIILPDTSTWNVEVEFRQLYMDVDLNKFKQVFRTLLSNTIENTPPEGKITVSFKLVTVASSTSTSMLKSDVQSQSNHMLQFIIQDTSSSLILSADKAKDTLRDSALTFTAGVLQTREGKGLGLWISHRIMELHKGKLSVHSLQNNNTVTTTTSCPSVPSYTTSPSATANQSQCLGRVFTVEIPVQIIPIRNRNDNDTNNNIFTISRQNSNMNSNTNTNTISNTISHIISNVPDRTPPFGINDDNNNSNNSSNNNSVRSTGLGSESHFSLRNLLTTVSSRRLLGLGLGLGSVIYNKSSSSVIPVDDLNATSII
eukprot:gene9637-20029_t